MAWWLKITDVDGFPHMDGPHGSSDTANAEKDVVLEEDPTKSCEVYEADRDEWMNCPRPMSKVLSKEGWVEHWTDGSSRLLT